MSDSACFDRVCEVLESETSLARLEARGTMRLMLKAAGLDPRNVTPAQMTVVVEKLLSAELAKRGVEDVGRACRAVTAALSGMAAPAASSSPEAVFARLGG